MVLVLADCGLAHNYFLSLFWETVAYLIVNRHARFVYFSQLIVFIWCLQSC